MRHALTRSRLILLLLAVVLGGACLVLLSRLVPTTISYRVDATLLVDGQELSSSSVWNLTMTEGLVGGSGTQWLYRVRGEALRFDPPDGPDLFLLRRGRDSLTTTAFGAFPIGCLDEPTREAWIRAVSDFRGPCSSTSAPALVTFDDPADPVTLRKVGYRVASRGEECETICLRSLTATRTSEPVSTGLVAYLPWLAMGEMGSEIGTGEKATSHNLLTFYNVDFSTELGWPDL